MDVSQSAPKVPNNRQNMRERHIIRRQGDKDTRRQGDNVKIAADDADRK